MIDKAKKEIEWQGRDKLWKEFTDGPTKRMESKLHGAYIPYIKGCAARYVLHSYLRNRFEDLCQEGHHGLALFFILKRKGKRHATMHLCDYAAKKKITWTMKKKADGYIYRHDPGYEEIRDAPLSMEKWEEWSVVKDEIVRLAILLMRVNEKYFVGLIAILKKIPAKLNRFEICILRSLLYNCLSQEPQAIKRDYYSKYVWIHQMPIDLTGG